MRLLVIALLALAGAACARHEGKVRAILDGDEDHVVVIVGKVQLVPPLAPGEQDASLPHALRNQFLLTTDSSWREIRSLRAGTVSRGAVQVPLEATYFGRVLRRPFYILAGSLSVGPGNTGAERAYFPGGFKVDVRPDDRAVYVGTLVYHRDAFFKVSKVELKDEYDAAHADFTAKYGPLPLRKSLAEPYTPKLAPHPEQTG